jgi:hypothetical protein
MATSAEYWNCAALVLLSLIKINQNILEKSSIGEKLMIELFAVVGFLIIGAIILTYALDSDRDK